MPDSYEISDIIPATPQAIYDAWLSAEGHSAITGGGKATSDPRVGGKFTAFDGYIWGTYLELDPGKRILTAWHTAEFPEGAADSRFEVILEAAPGGAKVTFRHSEIPEGQGESYKQGWVDFYFAPMKAHFGGGS